MSLRDRFRTRNDSRTGDEISTGDGSGPSADPLAGAEIDDFEPRPDGDYHCASKGLYLRFIRPAVTETDSTGAEPARGEFTTSGRFTVQRRFARPVVYTVLAVERPDSDDAVLVVRRTDTADRSAERLEFTFEPDRR